MTGNNRLSFFDDTNKQSGLTLVELLVALLIASIITAAILGAYTFNRDIYEAQNQITEMQQNLRSATMQMTREIRMAGYNPTEEAGAGITVATSGRFGFTLDIGSDTESSDSDGDTDDKNENIIFGYSAAIDADDDGIPDNGNAETLGRNTGGGYQPIATYIQAVEFYYTLNDGTKVLPTTGSPLSDVQIEMITSVQLSILARTRYPDRKFTNKITYHPASNAAEGTAWGPYNDNYRRRLLTVSITCRNLD